MVSTAAVELDPFKRPWLGRATVALANDVKPRSRRTSDGHPVVRAVRPSAAIENIYRKRLDALVVEMDASVLYWLGAAWKRNQQQIDRNTFLAQDASPIIDLTTVVRRLKRRWNNRFDAMAQELAKYFAKAVTQRSDVELKKILKRAGWTVEFTITQPMREALRAIVAENVALIKSIPQQYLTQVETAVMRSVVAGRDLGTLSDELRNQFGVTKRRAALIARDQNNKATGALQRIRFQEVGITRAIWRHSAAGKEPRPTHVANDGQEYDVGEGWFDPAVQQFIRPGELINCRCVALPVLPR